MLVLLDRAFDANAFLAEVAGTGAMLLARAKATRNPAVVAHLPDGSYMARLDDLSVRMIDADVAMTGTDGSRVADRYRLITTLTDCRAFPAAALARLYHERWEIESAFLALGHTLLAGRVLRSGDRPGVEQELWALLTLYQLLRMAMVADAELLPLRLPAVLAVASVPLPPAAEPGAQAAPGISAPEPAELYRGGPVEFERVVPASGNMTVTRRQFWLGPHRSGMTVTFWASTEVIHLLIAGATIQTLRSHLSTADLTVLAATGGRPAGHEPRLTHQSIWPLTACLSLDLSPGLPAPAWLTGWPDQKLVRAWRVTHHRYAVWCSRPGRCRPLTAPG
jgi:Transposase DDE domain